MLSVNEILYNIDNPDMQYDMCAKYILSYKYILAYIVRRTIPYFKDMFIDEIVFCFEDEPQISSVSVTNTNTSNIRGYNIEDSVYHEGKIFYDILFGLRTKHGPTKVIINIEAQKKLPTSYDILNRGVYYVSRLISSQKEVEFTGSNYNDIKPVYSVWICMNQNNSFITNAGLNCYDVVGTSGIKLTDSLFNIYFIGISNDIKENEKDDLLYLMGVLFSDNLTTEQRLDEISIGYNIPLSKEFDKGVNTMCNLSEGIKERAKEEGKTEGREEGKIKEVRSTVKRLWTKNIRDLDLISIATGLTVDDVHKLIVEMGLDEDTKSANSTLKGLHLGE